MSARRAQSMPPAAMLPYDKPARGRCVSALCISWKVFTCVFSHVMLVTLVVAYCWMGAITFEHLEAANEREVKNGIKFIRGNLIDSIWNLTHTEEVLYEKNWTEDVSTKLEAFEKELYKSMKVQGWDGNEDDKIQWTRTGALFYSIIVITTIGYGHIAPKTLLGKISTICYAILGIPLMLLCLSNIGDIMASSFRFIYWRVCCFACTREPKRFQNARRLRRGVSEPNRPAQQHQQQRISAKSHASMRRSIRVSQRTNDSGIDNYYEPRGMQHSHSDTELRYTSHAIVAPNSWERSSGNNSRSASGVKNQGFSRPAQRLQNRDRHTLERDRNVSSRSYRNEAGVTCSPIFRSRQSSQRQFARSQSMAAEPKANRDTKINMMTLPASYGRNKNRVGDLARDVRAQSLDPRGNRHEQHHGRHQEPPHPVRHSAFNFEFDDTDGKAPIFCNKYAIDEMDNIRPINGGGGGGYRASQRCQSMPRPATTRSNHDMRRGSMDNDGDGGVRPRQSDDTYRGGSMHSSSHQRHHRQPQHRPADADATNHRQPPHHQLQHQQHHYPNGGHQHQDQHNHLQQHHQYAPQQQQQRHRLSPSEQLYRHADEDEDDFNMHPIRHCKRRERPAPIPSPRIMTPMGFAIHRQARLQSAHMDDDSQFGDFWDFPYDHPSRVRPVPIWLCVFLVVSYIIAGAYWFSRWENWSFLDSAYFCFITLTTIGFGDFVPAQGVQTNVEMSIAFCSLYLLFGIALLAMSFNLVQEEVIANVKNVARQLGILKEEETDY